MEMMLPLRSLAKILLDMVIEFNSQVELENESAAAKFNSMRLPDQAEVLLTFIDEFVIDMLLNAHVVAAAAADSVSWPCVQRNDLCNPIVVSSETASARSSFEGT